MDETEQVALIVGNNSVFNDLKKIFRVSNTYKFAKQFINDKWGFYLLAIKSFAEVWRPYDEVYFNGCKGLFQERTFNQRKMYEYIMWDNQEKEELTLNFLVDKNYPFESKMQEIVCSLNLKKEQKTIDDYYNEGIQLFEQSDYKDSQFAFAYVVQAEPNDAKSHYYLAYSFYKLGDLKRATIHAEKARSFGYDENRIKDLLAEIKAIRPEGDSNKLKNKTGK